LSSGVLSWSALSTMGFDRREGFPRDQQRDGR
jgi:hypothetical protein